MRIEARRSGFIKVYDRAPVRDHTGRLYGRLSVEHYPCKGTHDSITGNATVQT